MFFGIIGNVVNTQFFLNTGDAHCAQNNSDFYKIFIVIYVETAKIIAECEKLKINELDRHCNLSFSFCFTKDTKDHIESLKLVLMY